MFHSHRVVGFVALAAVLAIVSILPVWAADPKPVTDGPKPKWVWSEKPGAGQTLYLYRSFDLNWAGDGLRPATAVLTATCDNRMKVLVNGQVVAQSTACQEYDCCYRV